jgi:hypothetical protein
MTVDDLSYHLGHSYAGMIDIIRACSLMEARVIAQEELRYALTEAAIPLSGEDRLLLQGAVDALELELREGAW